MLAAALAGITLNPDERNFPEARKLLERGIQKYPKNAQFHYQLALSYLSEANQLAVDAKTKDPTGELRKAKLDKRLRGPKTGSPRPRETSCSPRRKSSFNSIEANWMTFVKR